MEGVSSTALLIVAIAHIILGYFYHATRKGSRTAAPADPGDRSGRGAGAGGGSRLLTPIGGNIGLVEVFIISLAFITIYGVIPNLPIIGAMANELGRFLGTVILVFAVALFFKNFLAFLSIDISETAYAIVSMTAIIALANRFPAIEQVLIIMATAIGIGGAT